VALICCAEPDGSPSRPLAPPSDLQLPGGGWFHAAVPVLNPVAASKSRRIRIEENPAARALLAAAHGDWDQATRFLDRAHSLPPSIVASDKAAVALAAAATGKDSFGRVTALAATDQAVRADPKNERVWYNRALVLEQLELASSAVAAWRRYLKLASGASSRVEEARRHLLRLVVAAGPGACWRRNALWAD